jgi:hypothetical protein
MKPRRILPSGVEHSLEHKLGESRLTVIRILLSVRRRAAAGVRFGNLDLSWRRSGQVAFVDSLQLRLPGAVEYGLLEGQPGVPAL